MDEESLLAPAQQSQGVVRDDDDDLRHPLLSDDPASRSRLEKGVSHLSAFKTSDALFESLDYEIIENDVFKQDWRARNRKEVFVYIITKWFFAFLTGLLTGAAALFLNFSVENIAGSKWMFTRSYMNSGRTVTAFFIFTGLNTALVLIGSVMTVYLAPAAAGSGVPETKAYLNGIDAPRILEPHTLLIKLLGSICVVSAGLYLGKEGPLIHIGSCIAYFLGQGGSRRYHMKWSWLTVFRNDRDRRDLVTCGCAGGVAAAFRAPIGGVMFALEEVTSWWRSALLWRAFFTTAIVAVVLQLGKQFCSRGICGLFGEGGLIMFDISQAFGNFGLLDLLPVVVLGVVGGVLGSLFNKLNTMVTRSYISFYLNKPRYVKVLHACFMGILTSVCCFWLPFLAKCRPCPDLSDLPYECPSYGVSGNFKIFNCPAGHYNDLAGLFFATKDDAVRNLFSYNTYREYHYISILIFLVGSFIFSLITYGIAVPSGLFIPVIINGASVGRLVGMVMKSTTGNTLDEGLYAVLGAAAVLGGSMRMTVSLCVILLELTNNMLMLPMIMLVLLISKTIGDIFNSAIWELYVKIKGYPILEAKPEPFMQQLTAKDAITTPLVSFPAVESVRNILLVLRNTTHNGFPVMDVSPANGRKVFLGLVLRSHILVLLKNKAFFHPTSTSNEQGFKALTSADFAKPATGRSLTVEEVEISSEEEEEMVDLRGITNASPYTVVETASLAKAYSLFRQLGLRHLCVLSREAEGDPVVGVLTRHNFLHENLAKTFPYLMPRTIESSSGRAKSILL